MLYLTDLGWKIIPAENVISAFSNSNSLLMATASSSAEGLLMLEVIEVLHNHLRNEAFVRDVNFVIACGNMTRL